VAFESIKARLHGKKSFYWCLVELALAEVHLGVLRHELGHDILLLLVVACRQSHLLLSLVVHHLLHQTSRFTIEIGELRGLRVDLLGGDGKVGGDELVPPRHLVDLLEGHDDGVLVDCPERVFCFDFCVEFAVDDGRLVLEAEFQGFLADDADDVARLETGDVGERHAKLETRD
jgi:hypothetical protein